ncbi:MAG: hypothetical protein RML40_07415 [Bacteroidota bacterium]|nr:hypothetical protein [Candidatus Kapabacteria bacterium]MDW8220343.1 hypothetical protein [Bacteroidota bacterium]
MKRIRIFFAVVLGSVLTFPVLASAQPDEVFKVIACKGKITLERTKKPLSVGLGLNSADQLRLEGPVYLGLVHKSGKAVEIRNQGIVNVKDILPPPGKASGMDKLVGFVVNAVKGAEEGKNIKSASVEMSINVNKIRLISPRTTKTIDDEMTFTWHGSVDGKPATYLFTITDANQNVRYKKELTETQITVNLKALNLEKDRCYYWSVTQTNAQVPSIESYCLFLVNDAEATSLNNQLQLLRQDQNVPPTALDKLMLGAFYEQNGLTYRAMSAYKEAAAMGSDVEIFTDSYREFLRRTGVDYETMKLILKDTK